MPITDNDLMAKMGEGGSVQLTPLSNKLCINGETKPYSVYKIKLNELRYNVQNDRIATWVSEYDSQNNGELPDDVEELNNIIENFIVESNPQAIKKTQDDIDRNTQQEPAVVLNNGVLIDGNRRFTCLRRLAKENPKFGWIEAIILPPETMDDKKAIKVLELSIQHGKDSKVDYDPIDRLVGVYKDVIKEELLTEEEYAQASNISLGEVRKMINRAQYLADFLEFINAPEKFYLARKMKLSGPINEIEAILKNVNGVEEQERVKNCIFANLIVEPAGDMTRFIRKFKKILKSSGSAVFVEKESELTERVVDKLADLDNVTVESIRDNIRNDINLADEFESVLQESDRSVRGQKITESSNSKIIKAAEMLREVDVSLLKTLSGDDFKQTMSACEELRIKVEEITSFIEQEMDEKE